MIKVSVMYPTRPGALDHQYYETKHMRCVERVGRRLRRH